MTSRREPEATEMSSEVKGLTVDYRETYRNPSGDLRDGKLHPTPVT